MVGRRLLTRPKVFTFCYYLIDASAFRLLSSSTLYYYSLSTVRIIGIQWLLSRTFTHRRTSGSLLLYRDHLINLLLLDKTQGRAESLGPARLRGP